MKKTISIALLIMTLCSCVTDKAEKNIREFVMAAIERSIALDVSKVKDIKIEYEDSLLSPIVASISINEMLKAKSDFYAGNISQDSLDMVSIRCFGYYEALNYSWNIDPSVVKNKKEHADELRRVYRVTVTFEDGKTRNPRAIMDKDGITPVSLESEVQGKIVQLGHLTTY